MPNQPTLTQQYDRAVKALLQAEAELYAARGEAQKDLWRHEVAHLTWMCEQAAAAVCARYSF